MGMNWDDPSPSVSSIGTNTQCCQSLPWYNGMNNLDRPKAPKVSHCLSWYGDGLGQSLSVDWDGKYTLGRHYNPKTEHLGLPLYQTWTCMHGPFTAS